MQTTCLNCGHRDEGEWFICPKCGDTTLHMPYGQDTTILVSKENLGQSIQLTSNANEVKNCFRITGGDEYINAAIISANPNGTNVIYEFDEDTRKDMPNELIKKVDSYDELVKEYRNNHVFELDNDIVSQVNSIIAKINSIYPDKFETVKSSYTGYSHITEKDYDMKDLYLYLNSSMMPTWEQADTTAQDQVKLVEDELSVVSVKDISVISKSTADNAVLLMVRAIIDTNIYKPELVDTSLSSQIWKGKVKLTNYSNEEDTATSKILTVKINDDMENFLNQNVQKITAKIDTLGVKELFDIDDVDEFKAELKKYCLASLNSFENAYNTVLLSLTEVKASETDSEFYESFYAPYYEKLGLIQEEKSVRDTDIGIVMVMQEELSDIVSDTKETLNFENYLGEELWNTFISYRREDSYSNENYISDGLSNAELIQKANEFIEVAHRELIKSSSKQYTISGTLTNLLLITDEDGKQVFAPILEDFTLGNFIRCKIDGVVYRMRIMDVTIDYDNLTTLSITFGDVTKGKTLPEKMNDVIKQSNSVAASYSTVKKQAKQGENAGNTLEKLRQEGLNSAQYNVFNTNSTFIMDNHGLLGRNYDDVTNQFTPEQFRINGCNIIMTDDAWASTRLAIGKQIYMLNGRSYETYGVNADTVIGGTMIAGDIYSANYTTDNEGNLIIGNHFGLNNSEFELADGKIVYKNNKLKMTGINVDWSTSATPSIDDIKGLNTELEDRPTTVEMSAAIKASADSITSTVSQTYETKTNASSQYNTLSSSIQQNAKSISTKVEQGNVISEINQSAEQIKITGNRFVVESTNFKLSADGTIKASNGEFTGNIISENAIVSGGNIGGWKITSTDIYDENNIGAGVGKYGTSPAFWAGASYSSRLNAPFQIGHNGVLTTTGKGVTSDGITYSMQATLQGGQFQNDHLDTKSRLTIQGHLLSVVDDNDIVAVRLGHSGITLGTDKKISSPNADITNLNSSNITCSNEIVSNSLNISSGSCSGTLSVETLSTESVSLVSLFTSNATITSLKVDKMQGLVSYTFSNQTTNINGNFKTTLTSSCYILSIKCNTTENYIMTPFYSASDGYWWIHAENTAGNNAENAIVSCNILTIPSSMATI